MERSTQTADSVRLNGDLTTEQEFLVSPDALNFVAILEREFRERRTELLAQRKERAKDWDSGWRPQFLEETRTVRESNWKVPPTPTDLQDRRVEITGPTERKMVINALNSGAQVFMADFEDSSSPTWENCIQGQVNLRDAVAGTIDFTHPTSGKQYALGEELATLVVRPRGWHLNEKHLVVDGRPVAAGIFDFAIYLFHNADALIEKGTGPYFYLPKLESHLEARLWNDLFVMAQEELGLSRGTIKATVLIETLPAAFEMDEILYELQDHAAGLNCGRWDYIFSFIKKHRADPTCTLPDRGEVGMDRHFMRSYSQLLIKTCHRRGAHAMGGMAAQIPIKGDPKANEQALERVRADKHREATDGHDGTWVAHPGLVATALEEFDKVLNGKPNQLDVMRDDVIVSAEDLLRVPAGDVTEAGLRQNVNVGIRYLAAWLAGNGCVPIDHLMEDAATAEISRTQLWQWRKHAVQLDDGRIVDDELVTTIFEEELGTLREFLGDGGFEEQLFPRASELFKELVMRDGLVDFLTSFAAPYLP
jgi:malate synthase